MQDTKTKASVLPPVASCGDDVKSETHTAYHAVSTDAAGAGEVSVEAVVPSLSDDCRPLPTEAEAESRIGLCSDVDNFDNIPAASIEVLSSSSNAFTSADAGASGQVSVEAVTPSPSSLCQPLLTEAQSEVIVDHCDSTPVADTEVLFSSSSAVTSAISTDAGDAGEVSVEAVTPCPSAGCRSLSTEAHSEVFVDDIPPADTCLLYTSPSPRDS